MMVFDLCHTLLPTIHVLPVSETSSSAEPKQSSLAPINFLQYCQPDSMVFLASPPTHLTFPVALTYLLRHCSPLSCCRVCICLGGGGGRSFPDSSVGKECACNAGDPSWIPGSGRSAGEGIGYPLQYSWASTVAQLVKNPPATAGHLGLIPGLRTSPGEVYALLSCKCLLAFA